MAQCEPSDLQGVQSREAIPNRAASGNLQHAIPSLGQSFTSPQAANQISMFSGPMAAVLHQIHNNQARNISESLEARRTQELLCPPLPTQGQGISPSLPIGTSPISGLHSNHSQPIGMPAMQGILQGSQPTPGFPQLSSMQGYQGNAPMPLSHMAIPQAPQGLLASPNAVFQPNPANNAAIPMMTPQPGQQGNRVFRNNESIFVPSLANFNLWAAQYAQQSNAVIGNMPQQGQPAQMMQMQPAYSPANVQLQDGPMMVNTAMHGFQTNGIISPTYIVPSVNGQQMTSTPTQNTLMAVAGGSLSNNMSTVSQPVQGVAAVPSQFQGFCTPCTFPNMAAMSQAQLQLGHNLPGTQFTPQVGQMIGVSSQCNQIQGSSGNQATVITPSNYAANVQQAPMNCNEGNLSAVQRHQIPPPNGNLQQLVIPWAAEQGHTGFVQQRQTVTSLPLPVNSLHQDTTHIANRENMQFDSLGMQSVRDKNKSSCPAPIQNQTNSNSQHNELVGVQPMSSINEQFFSGLEANQTGSQSSPWAEIQINPHMEPPLDQLGRLGAKNCPQPTSRSLPASSNSTSTQSTLDQRIQQVLADIDEIHGSPELLQEEEIPAFMEDMRTGEPFDPPSNENERSKNLTQIGDLPRSPLTSRNTQDLATIDVLFDSALGHDDSLKMIGARDSDLDALDVDMSQPSEPDQTPNTNPRTLTTTAGEEIEIKVSMPSVRKNSSTNTVPPLSTDDDSQIQHYMEIMPSDSNQNRGDPEEGEVTRTKNCAQDLHSLSKNQNTSNEFSMTFLSENKPVDQEISPAPQTIRESPKQERPSKSEIAAEAWEAYFNYDWARMTTPDRRKRRRHLINRKRLPFSQMKVVKTTRNGDQPIWFRRLTDDEIFEVIKLYPRMVRRKKAKKVRNRMVAQRNREQKRQTTEKLQKENEKLRSQNAFLRADAAMLIEARAENAKLKERLDNLIQSNPGLVLTPESSGNGESDDINPGERRESPEEPSEVTSQGSREKDACI